MNRQSLSADRETYLTQAEELFTNSRVHYNCAQSVLIPFAKDCGISEEKGYQLGMHFGSGMKMGGCCGAITGGLMVIGMLGGGDKEYQKFMKNMRTQHDGLVNCADLLRDSAVSCSRLVYDAVSAVADAFSPA